MNSQPTHLTPTPSNPPPRRDGVGCSCGWPLDGCNINYSKDGRCDAEEIRLHEEAVVHAAKPRYVALNCPAWINGKEVLLAVRKDSDPENRRVIAMFADEARWLHDDGRLDGWTPHGHTPPSTRDTVSEGAKP